MSRYGFNAMIAMIAVLVVANVFAAQPTGKEWEDETALHYGKEAPTAAFASFASVEEAKAMADLFVATPFSEAERHARRLAMLDRYEETGELPPLPDAAR